ncbi:hypothetical protein [Aromatoleum aromaticum]|uniref:hypothetical protein n=1 Tax=Aromatoleum aromaticum TaxID=551760 RepID=UPI0002DB5228|nr:hypothetical protein [Aromatoleum aromaticum]NMG53395.1 hypothetical protein [Aromatoleum aromaticum]
MLPRYLHRGARLETRRRAGEDFTEPGALDLFALLAAQWLRAKLPPVADGVERSGQPDRPAPSHPL